MDIQARLKGIRGDGSEYPWNKADERAYTEQWFDSLPTPKKEQLKAGGTLTCFRFFNLLEEEIRLSPNCEVSERR